LTGLSMDAQRLGYYRERLLEKRLSLAAMVERAEGYGREKDTATQDIGDLAAQSYTREFLFGKSAGDRQVLRMIDEALGRIEDATYGDCVRCGNPVQPKRLEAVPWAECCIECQALAEKGM